ncbi:hypothetical protein CE91St43_19260 [Oscillospiraceae bacterium]|nr:hypothetical protein CE91St43_19260 [Oscillospiraceae bacterium]
MKRFCSFFLAVVLALTVASPALAAEEAIQAKGVAMYFRIDGKMHSRNLPYEYENNMFASYLIGDEHYVQLRHVALAMNYSTTPFDVQYNAETNSVEVIPGVEYTAEKAIPNFLASRDLYDSKAVPSANPIFVNGVERQVKAYAIEGHNYLRLRDIADLAGFTVTWDQETGVVGLWSGASIEGVHRVTVNGGAEDDYQKYQNARLGSTPNYEYPKTCSLYDSGNGTVTVVDASARPGYDNDFLNYGSVEVSVYDTSDFSRISTKTLPEELPMFGAFLHGETYNYICYGQENPNQDDKLEVLRIVKYDADWNRLGAVSVRGDGRNENQLMTPFYGGGAAMVELGDTVILHYSKTYYVDYTGESHQGSATLGFNMKNYTQEKGTRGWGTSHSLGTDIVAGKDSFVTIDVADADMHRALTFYRADTAPFSYPDESQAGYMFPQPGTGIPGLTYGDAAATATHYVATAGERDPKYWIDEPAESMFRIVVAAVPMNNVSTTGAKEYVVGDYWHDSEKFGFMPTVCSLPDGRAIVLWQEYQRYDRNGYVYSDKPLDVKYVVLNKDGSPSSKTGTLEGYNISTCQPQVVGDQVMWYANLNNTRYFYTVPLEDL